MERIVCGIDPGINGALVMIDQKRNVVSKLVMPYDKKIKEIDCNALFEFFMDSKNNIDCIFLEAAASRPLQSSKSTFTSGMNFGILRALISISKIKFEIVHPSKWTKEVCVGLPASLDTKAKALLSAKRLFPQYSFIPEKCKVPHTGLVDAVLIAEYGMRRLR